MTKIFDFESQYQLLNPEQKLAVDTIEGPVMVIAGAGTGKTQTLTMRIGQILRVTQVNPQNILCLTFTDSAAVNMRQRLNQLIGPSAYGVRIGTFHSFANSVIADHPEKFLRSKKESIMATDVAKIDIIHHLLDNLDSTSPLKSIYSAYFFQKDILSTIDNLKKENITPNDFAKLINDSKEFCQLSSTLIDQLSQLRADAKQSHLILSLVDQLISSTSKLPIYSLRLATYKNLFDTSALRLPDFKKQIINFFTQTNNNISKLESLNEIYRGYQESLGSQGLFDYQDMINWVIDAFEHNQDLLAEYQEKFQYILVDEFQDTNNSQLKIIDLLTQGNPSPNLFVVGDDDQSIYRFSGASVENVFQFAQKYLGQQPPIVLKNNYRSHRIILDSSAQVIRNNQNRISSYIDKIDKTLTASSGYDPNPINLFEANNLAEENYFVGTQIKKILDSGASADSIAVLYRNNRDVEELIPQLRRQGIKYVIANSVNILESTTINSVIDIIKYLLNPTDKILESRVLNSKFIGISPTRLFQYFHQQQPLTGHKYQRFLSKVTRFQKISTNLSLTENFTWVIRRFRILNYLLKNQHFDELQYLNQLFDHLKSAQSIEQLTLSQWIGQIDTLIENKLGIDSQPLLTDSLHSIRLMTVHKAKGLEFDHVFLYSCQSGRWDQSSSRKLIKLPLGVVKTDITSIAADADIEEDRRLFYVALTRAKKQIYISYSQFSPTQKPIARSVFINEIDPNLIEVTKLTPEIQQSALAQVFAPSVLLRPDVTSVVGQYLSTRYRFNITHLNSYLKCPLCFFFNTILRLPHSKNRSTSFGTAVHGALNYLLTVIRTKKTLIDRDQFLKVFANNLEKERLSDTDYRDLLAQGQQILESYYDHYQPEFDQNNLSEVNFGDYHIHLNNIPVTGKIDKIEINPDKTATVVDFKTGRPDNKYQELSPDGDYFRQLVFYKLLTDKMNSFPYKITRGAIDFIQPNTKGDYVKKVFDLTDDDVARLTIQITEIFNKINHLDFSPSPDCEDKDHLHYLHSKYFK